MLTFNELLKTINTAFSKLIPKFLVLNNFFGSKYQKKKLRFKFLVSNSILHPESTNVFRFKNERMFGKEKKKSRALCKRIGNSAAKKF